MIIYQKNIPEYYCKLLSVVTSGMNDHGLGPYVASSFLREVLDHVIGDQTCWEAQYSRLGRRGG
jgi:hypothetical protein